MRLITLSLAIVFSLSNNMSAQCGWVLWSKADKSMEDGKLTLNRIFRTNGSSTTATRTLENVGLTAPPG